MRKLLIISLLAMCSQAFGQAARFDGIALSTTSTGNPLTTVTVPLPSASITVYNYGTLTKAAVCPDITAVGCTAIAPNNPITADARGNFGFWIAGGVYQYTVCPVGGVCQGPYNAVVPFGSNSSGSVTYSKSFENIRFADQFAGADDGIKINAAIADLPSTGGKVFIPSGSYTLTTGISTNLANLEIECAGGNGDEIAGVGATKLLVPSGVTGFTFNSAASSTNFRGPIIRNCQFYAQSGATGGINIKRANNFLLDNVAAYGFTAGFGIKLDGTGNLDQYGTLLNVRSHDNQIGIDMVANSGTRIIGGHLDANLNSGATVAGTTGIRLSGTGNSTTRIFGTVIQYYETGVDIQGGINNEIHGMRGEGMTTHIQDAGQETAVYGGSFNNAILGGSTGTAISITAASVRGFFMPASIVSVATRFNNLGTNTTMWSSVNGALDIPSSVIIRWPANSAFFQTDAVGRIKATSNFWVQQNIVVDFGNSGSKLLFGSANDTNLYRSASNTLKTDGGMFFGGTNASITSAGLGTFNGGVQVAGAISPTVAGAQTAGTNPLPFSSVYVGAAATNNAQLTGTFTAARVHTLPDITGNVSVYLSASDAAVDLASVASAACTTERTVAVTGAAFGDAVDVMAGTALEAGGFLTGKVISAGNIKWQFCNLSGGAIDRASDTYSIRVRK